MIVGPNGSVSSGRHLRRTRVGLIFLLPYHLFFVIFICGFFSLYGLLLFAFEIVKISDFFTKVNDKTSLIFGCVYKFLSNSNIIMLLSLLF